MDDFEILSPEGERLLREIDSSRLSSFLSDFRDRVADSLDDDSLDDDEQWHSFFSQQITNAPGSHEDKARAMARVGDFVRWYRDVMNTDYDNDLPRTRIQQIVDVPESEFDFTYKIPDMCMGILAHHIPIMEAFLPADLAYEVKWRVIRALMVQMTHPL